MTFIFILEWLRTPDLVNICVTKYKQISDNGDTNEVHSAQEKLLHSFRSGTSACLVCIETIKKEEAVSFLCLTILKCF